jgi:hypothetical protein
MTGGENRRRSIVKALRKRRIDHDVYYHLGTTKDPEAGYYKNLHQYSKNKIHCSCPICSAKTRNKGHKISDVRKIQKLEYKDD